VKDLDWSDVLDDARRMRDEQAEREMDAVNTPNLMLEHPEFGVQADPDNGFEMWTVPPGWVDEKSHTWIGCTWWKRGQGGLWANVPAEEVRVIELWSCTWYCGLMTECGDDAQDFRDGLPLCSVHAHVWDNLA
jgi:hypothetical protein